MPQFIAKGTRVIWEGNLGIVKNDSGEDWQTASVEFYDDKGVVIQKLKSELNIVSDEPKKGSALAKVVGKLDRRNKSISAGYITNPEGLIAILGEVSPLVSVSIVEKELPYAEAHKNIAVEIKLSLTLERDLL